jgi:hypothetical protein
MDGEYPTQKQKVSPGKVPQEAKEKIFSRIDRKYTTKLTWETANEFKMINCDVSDHNGDSVTVREVAAPITAKGEQKLGEKKLRYIWNKHMPNIYRTETKQNT